MLSHTPVLFIFHTPEAQPAPSDPGSPKVGSSSPAACTALGCHSPQLCAGRRLLTKQVLRETVSRHFNSTSFSTYFNKPIIVVCGVYLCVCTCMHAQYMPVCVSVKYMPVCTCLCLCVYAYVCVCICVGDVCLSMDLELTVSAGLPGQNSARISAPIVRLQAWAGLSGVFNAGNENLNLGSHAWAASTLITY